MPSKRRMEGAAGRTVVCGSSDSYAEFGDLDGYLIRFEGTVLPDEFELEELDVEDGTLDVLDLEALGIHMCTSSSGDRMLHAAFQKNSNLFRRPRSLGFSIPNPCRRRHVVSWIQHLRIIFYEVNTTRGNIPRIPLFWSQRSQRVRCSWALALRIL